MSELGELDKGPSGAWWPYIVGLVVVLAAVAVFVRRRRRRVVVAALAFALLLAESGCGTVSAPIVKLTGSYQESFFFVDPRPHEPPMALVVRNDGNQPLRLLKADGGCSCRKVDQSVFPVALKPGNSVTVRVDLSMTPVTKPQSSQFQFDTDKGPLFVTALFFTLLSHELSPETIVNSLMYEPDDWTFNVTHRVVHRADHAQPEFALRFPSEFKFAQGATRSGRVGGAPDYAYEETDYTLSLSDHGLGDHKSSLSVVEPRTKVILLEAPSDGSACRICRPFRIGSCWARDRCASFCAVRTRRWS